LLRCARNDANVSAMTIAIIDYGSGNLRSAAKAFERMANEHGIKGPVRVTKRPEEVAAAERIVLPGQGAFADCRRGLAAIAGLEEALSEAVIARGRPFFGICVGMQLMAERGREFETVPGLGWIGGDVVAIEPSDPGLKIPHMGWNELAIRVPHPVFAGVPSGTHFYFVHSFEFRPDEPGDLLAAADYGGPVVASVGRDNLFGTQFHPEKSQMAGLRLIANFLRWRP
jgi:imidazole glycerol-phosphate synthase subunit HisH